MPSVVFRRPRDLLKILLPFSRPARRRRCSSGGNALSSQQISLQHPFIAIAGSSAQGGVIHFYGQIVEPACDVSTQSSPVEMNCPQNGSVPGRTYSSKALMSGNVKNAQIASVKVQYLDKQKKLAVMNIEYN